MTLSLLIRRLDSAEQVLERRQVTADEAFDLAARGEVVIRARPLGRAVETARSAIGAANFSGDGQAGAADGRRERGAGVVVDPRGGTNEQSPRQRHQPRTPAPRENTLELG